MKINAKKQASSCKYVEMKKRKSKKWYQFVASDLKRMRLRSELGQDSRAWKGALRNHRPTLQ